MTRQFFVNENKSANVCGFNVEMKMSEMVVHILMGGLLVLSVLWKFDCVSLSFLEIMLWKSEFFTPLEHHWILTCT